MELGRQAVRYRGTELAFYEIEPDGRLYSLRSGKYLKPNKDRYGYAYYVVSIHGKRLTMKAHRLVAETFIPNPLKKPTINHRNGVRDDNRVENLEWATPKEQAADPLTKKKFWAVVAKTDYRAMGAKRNFGRRQTAVYKDGTLVGRYESLYAAAKANKLCYSKASECANGLRSQTGGVQICYV